MKPLFTLAAPGWLAFVLAGTSPAHWPAAHGRQLHVGAWGTVRPRARWAVAGRSGGTLAAPRLLGSGSALGRVQRTLGSGLATLVGERVAGARPGNQLRTGAAPGPAGPVAAVDRGPMLPHNYPTWAPDPNDDQVPDPSNGNYPPAGTGGNPEFVPGPGYPGTGPSYPAPGYPAPGEYPEGPNGGYLTPISPRDAAELTEMLRRTPFDE